MIEVKYKDKIYQGEIRDVMVALRENERLSFSRIGELVGTSRQMTAYFLRDYGEPKFPELYEPGTFNEPDEVVAMRLNVSTSRVAFARRRLGIKSPTKVNLDLRRNKLSQYLFGKDAGPQFVDFMEKQLELIPEGRCSVLKDFYLLGLSSSPADRLNKDTARTYRIIAKKQLKKLTDKLDIEQLVKTGVLDG